VDEGLQRAGFIVVTGHGVDTDLAGRVRAASREFFALPTEVKACYSVPVGGHGWIVGPDGEVLGLTSRKQPFVTVAVDLGKAEIAKKTYPRYVLE
jgi:isopenicillin N synthase-like dioxygenase